MDPTRFVFLDETGATTAMTRRYGWGVRGERLVDAAPAGHWKTTTFVAGLRSTGIIAPLVLDRPMTGEWFRAYVDQMLAPSLQPGDVVVLDNLPAHKAAGVETAIRRVGASLLYLPSYSPELSRIEPDWNDIKQHHLPVRSFEKVAELKRAVDGALARKAYLLQHANARTARLRQANT